MAVNLNVVEDADRKISARRDVVSVVAVAALAALACAKFDLSEALLSWTRPFERLQLDELPAILLVIAVSLMWFSTRRYLDALRQIRLRRMVEAQLAEALAENQRLAQQYVNMQESERKALARDLHDELGQYLHAIKLDAVSIRDQTGAQPSLCQLAHVMIANIDRVYDMVTGLIRQLRPAGLDDLGVGAAVEHCVNEWRSRLPAAAIELTIRGEFEKTLDETRGLVLYRLVQEALTNIARHSGATKIEIRIATVQRADLGEGIEIIIADNGSGADMRAPQTGLGLVGMRERVSSLGGSLKLVSEPGAGFKIVAALPIAGNLS